MKNTLSLLLLSGISVASYGQLTNSSVIHVSEGAVVTVNTPVNNQGSIANNGKLNVKSDIKNNGKIQSNGELAFNGSGVQTVSGNGIEANKVVVENDVKLTTDLKVNNEMAFNNGVVSTDKSVSFGENATSTGASDNSHIVGKVSKEGSDNFEFPIGDGSNLKTLKAQNTKGGVMEAEYVASNPMDVSSEMDVNLKDINETEYWVLKTPNSDKVEVSINDNSAASLKSGVWTKIEKVVNAQKGTLITSAHDATNLKEIGVWPNPTKGEFNLKLAGMRDNSNITVEITNQDGRTIMKMSGTVKALRKAYRLPAGMMPTSLTVRVIEGTEAMTQKMILEK
ncbi:MAG: hypothetical protein ACRCVT_11225 [Leadbetterella sp.]